MKSSAKRVAEAAESNYLLLILAMPLIAARQFSFVNKQQEFLCSFFLRKTSDFMAFYFLCLFNIVLHGMQS